MSRRGRSLGFARGTRGSRACPVLSCCCWFDICLLVSIKRSTEGFARQKRGRKETNQLFFSFAYSSFGSAFWFLLLAAFTAPCYEAACVTAVHFGSWGVKVSTFVLLVVATFFLPNTVFDDAGYASVARVFSSFFLILQVSMRACVRACVRACACVCMRACECLYTIVSFLTLSSLRSHRC